MMLNERYDTLRQSIETIKNEKNFLARDIEAIDTQLSKIDETTKFTEKAIFTINAAITVAKKKIFPFFEALITKGIQIIFGAEYSFKIDVKESRKRIVAETKIVKATKNFIVELESEFSSGGLNDVQALLLKIIGCIGLGKGGPLVIDESFKFLSKDRSLKLISFLSTISKKFGIQIILISHDPNVDKAIESNVFDKVFQVKNVDGISSVEVIS